MPLTRKLLTVILLSLVVASSAFGAEQLTLKVYKLPLKEARSVPDKANWAIVQRFMELHPEIKLEGFQGITAAGLDMEVGPLLAMEAESRPMSSTSTSASPTATSSRSSSIRSTST